jgi:oxalate decarboxylase/phosphoglucose isomerase-like protein (cupin superfamily)
MALRFSPGSSVRHPLGVKPEGNIFLAENVEQVFREKRESLGPYFASLRDDTLILSVMSFMDGGDLLTLGCTSKYFAGFANHVDLWRDLFWETRDEKEKIEFASTWKETWINIVGGKRGEVSVKKVRRDEEDIAHPLNLPSVFSDVLYNPYRASGLVPTRAWLGTDNVERVYVSGLTRAEFEAQFERHNKPVILTGVVENWQANSQWNTVEKLVTRFENDIPLACGPVNLRMSEYQSYISSGIWRTDEIPYFVFDTTGFTSSGLTREYDLGPLHAVLSSDLYDLLPAPYRPEHAWLLVGPPGASSKWHVDPNSTSAWNAVIVGAKKWIMLPPHLGPPPGVEASGDGFAVRQPLTLTEWLEGFYEETKSRYGDKLIECTCNAGEVMYVPRGWWHCVRNIGPEPVTIAVTQNYVPESHVQHVRQFLKKYAHCVSGVDQQYRSSLWKEFDAVLRVHRPDVVVNDIPDEEEGDERENDSCEPVSFWGSFGGRSLNFER